MKIPIGKNVKRFRKHRRLTQEKLADRVGISLRYVQSIEDGSRIPTVKMLYKISGALARNIKDLF